MRNYTEMKFGRKATWMSVLMCNTYNLSRKYVLYKYENLTIIDEVIKGINIMYVWKIKV